MRGLRIDAGCPACVMAAPFQIISMSKLLAINDRPAQKSSSNPGTAETGQPSTNSNRQSRGIYPAASVDARDTRFSSTGDPPTHRLASEMNHRSNLNAHSDQTNLPVDAANASSPQPKSLSGGDPLPRSSELQRPTQPPNPNPFQPTGSQHPSGPSAEGNQIAQHFVQAPNEEDHSMQFQPLDPKPQASIEDGLDDLLARIQHLTSGGDSTSKPQSRPVAAKDPPNSAEQSRPRAGASQPDDAGKAKPFCPPWAKITNSKNEPMIPIEPTSLIEAGVTESVVEELVMRFLLSRGESVGRLIANQIKLPFCLVEPTLNRMKQQQFSAYAGATSVNDYVHVLTDAGRDRARRHMLKTTYFGAAPVALDDYVAGIKLQSIETQHPTREDLRSAFSDLLVSPQLLARVGPAVNSGRGMFLYGYPGNGKTSIAERVTKAFGEFIWIPRAITIDGEIVRIFDPLMHEAAPTKDEVGLLSQSNIDERWVRIRRPTIVAGGELTMAMLEVQRNPESNVSDAPLQLKSNCGVLLIDDFGRQQMTVDELLNRWIVPLEKRYDYLTVSSGKKTQVPFDQLVIFSTNLEPKDLVDDAFLRRIPYKIEVPNPTEEAFRKLFEIMCRVIKIPYEPDVIEYLIQNHYKPIDRPMRNCHPRDLLLQVRSYCLYNSEPLELTKEHIDFAVENYFSIM
jgi:hypothetical protein